MNNKTKAITCQDQTERRIEAVREFNRFYTGLIGVLRDGVLQSPYSLTEVRVLFELAHEEIAEGTDLRHRLGLDAGYLSRILKRLERAGLVRRERSSQDGRRQHVALTAAGREAFAGLDRRAAAEVRSLLAPLGDEDQRRLIGAMAAIRQTLESAAESSSFVLRPAEVGDFGWVVYRHGVLYAQEYGWDASFEALAARILAEFIERREPGRHAAWIAERDGERVGCVFCVPREGEDRVAQLRMLLVEPAARGAGIGSRLVEECLRFARRAGYREIMLWTNDVLAAARRIYERSGFELTEEEPHHAFGADLVGQTWRRSLG